LLIGTEKFSMTLDLLGLTTMAHRVFGTLWCSMGTSLWQSKAFRRFWTWSCHQWVRRFTRWQNCDL
jgi:hypothetical protein